MFFDEFYIITVSDLPGKGVVGHKIRILIEDRCIVGVSSVSVQESLYCDRGYL